jgi:glutathione synthase/RimK-type ligase-like ATP-grasp enzyme
MTNIIVLSTKVGEPSASILAEALKADIENPYETEKRDYTEYDYVFKYGFSKPIRAKKGRTFNKSEAVKKAVNKLKTFSALNGTGVTVEYTTDIDEAASWIRDGHILVARATVTGSNGEGITYIQREEDIKNTPALLWTKLVNEAQEFRAYLWKNKVLSLYVKTAREGIFSFKLIKEDESYTHPQLTTVVNAIYEKIGLDFCGIDIITDINGKLNVLEVNSSPILFPYTLKRLVNNITKEITNE